MEKVAQREFLANERSPSGNELGGIFWALNIAFPFKEVVVNQIHIDSFNGLFFYLCTRSQRREQQGRCSNNVLRKAFCNCAAAAERDILYWKPTDKYDGAAQQSKERETAFEKRRNLGEIFSRSLRGLGVRVHPSNCQKCMCRMGFITTNKLAGWVPESKTFGFLALLFGDFVSKYFFPNDFPTQILTCKRQAGRKKSDRTRCGILRI